MKNKKSNAYWSVIFAVCLGLGLVTAMTQFVMAQQSNPSALTANNIYYVAKSGTGQDGLSWTTAFTDMQDALAAATRGDEIWIAAGVYTPGTTVSDTFSLIPGADMYGGFAGDETELSQRDWTANPTILSGDIDGDDITDANGVITATTNIVGDNSYHVVSAAVGIGGTSITNSTKLDGFTITAGSANVMPDNRAGGGFYCVGSGPGLECSPTLNNIVFSGNLAVAGGGMSNFGMEGGISNPILNWVTFSGNEASTGGAIFNIGYDGGESSPVLNNIRFIDNGAGSNGGALYNEGADNGSSHPILNNVLFFKNFSSIYGGAISSYGHNNGSSHPHLNNVTIANNSATWGGALYHASATAGSVNSHLNNVILWQNSAVIEGAAMFNMDATVMITTSLVQGGITGTDIVNNGSNVIDGGGNIDVDPLFVDADSGNLRLIADSSAVDTGTNGLSNLSTDLDGNPRVSNGIIDMGAYELPFYSLTVTFAGEGSGEVSANGVHYNSSFTEDYSSGFVMTLTGTADTGSLFTGWDGGDCSGLGSCVVTITDTTVITATFALDEYFVYLPIITKP